MTDWNRLLVRSDAALRQAVACMDEASESLALVTDSGKVVGTVSDTAVRKFILAGGSLDEPVSKLMNMLPPELQAPVSGTFKPESSLLLQLTQRVHKPSYERVAVLMAGGPGERLRPLTQNCPKPLLKVKGKPLLQSTLENLINAGFERVYLAVNYKAEMVKDYFGDGKALGIKIEYLEEKTRLGTAGALSLLPSAPQQPILVMNGDVVTKLNFAQLLEFHAATGATATMSVRKYEYKIPYGLVQISGTTIEKLQEKPVLPFFVNAGIYVLNPEAVQRVPNGEYYDMPSLFEQLMKSGHTTSAFPIREQWIDIGDISEYERAQSETVTENFVATVTSAAPVVI